MSITTKAVLFPSKTDCNREWFEIRFNGKHFDSDQVLKEKIERFFTYYHEEYLIDDVIIYDDVQEYAIMLNDGVYPTNYWVVFVNVG